MIKSKYSASITDSRVRWWELAPSCVAAYQAKGAKSYDASKVNLANPGVYDLTATGAPTWSGSTGWGGFLTTAYLNTGITAGQLWTMIVRHTTPNPTALQFACGTDSASNRRFYLWPVFDSGGAKRVYGGGGYIIVTGGVHSNGVSAIAGRQGYFDGLADGMETNAAYSGDAEFPLLIGIANAAAKVFPWLGNIQAVAIYNSTLTVGNIADLSAAMAAL